MSYIDAYSTKDEVIVWERDEGGELQKNIFPVSDFCYLFMPSNSDESPTFRDIYNRPMKKVFFDTRWEVSQFAKGRENVCESDVQPVYKCLIDHYRDCKADAPYNVLLWDIEVDFDLDDGKGYPEPENPYGEINAISCFDASKNQYVMFLFEELYDHISLKDDRHGIPVKMEWCRNERDLLKRFCAYIEHIDVISAWNSDHFDVRYVMERLIKHFGDAGKSMLCRDGFDAKRRDFVNEYGQDTWEWSLVGRANFDMMKLFKKFHPGEKRSFSLDAVCQEELGESKIEYDDDLGSLYRENPQKFFEYSLHDSRLLKMLDDKQKVIDLAMMMVRDMCALPRDVTGSVNIINMAIIKFARNDGNIVLPDIKETKKEEFEGALVYDTIPGYHKWVFTIDIGALYPSSIILNGMSKENIILQCQNGFDDYVAIIGRKSTPVMFKLEDTGEVDSIPAFELHDIIRENGFTISAYGTVFDGTMGLLARFTKHGFDQRTHYKNLMKSESDEVLRSRYDLYQKVMKIRNNSIYGILSQPAFRLADIRIAASTTATGRVISLWQAYKSNEMVNILNEE